MPVLHAVSNESSNRAPAAFGKPGRPVKDATAERNRIYRAAGPLILRNGVRHATIRDVARASCLSPGGIYHYFRSKTDLVLHGLEPEALSRACTDAARELTALLAGASPPDADHVIELWVDKTLVMLDFVRPALHAAIELGRPELRQRLSAGLREDADSLMAALVSLDPEIANPDGSADLMRRTILGLALDETVSRTEARRQLAWLLSAVVLGRATERAAS
jgi:AcrR family transcriptional regulator